MWPHKANNRNSLSPNRTSLSPKILCLLWYTSFIVSIDGYAIGPTSRLQTISIHSKAGSAIQRKPPVRFALRMWLSRNTGNMDEPGWSKTGFVDGNRQLWYNNQTKKMTWRKAEFWEQDSGFDLQAFIREYGAAYVITALTLSIFSFTACYFIVHQSGIDVGQLFVRIGIKAGEGASFNAAGELALAFALHKAASPVRIPLGIALTPLVAGLFGKSTDEEEDLAAQALKDTK